MLLNLLKPISAVPVSPQIKVHNEATRWRYKPEFSKSALFIFSPSVEVQWRGVCVCVFAFPIRTEALKNCRKAVLVWHCHFPLSLSHPPDGVYSSAWVCLPFVSIGRMSMWVSFTSAPVTRPCVFGLTHWDDSLFRMSVCTGEPTSLSLCILTFFFPPSRWTIGWNIYSLQWILLS